ncbi:MAG: GntR family transcriptional regulator [Sphaerochaetaceae bacterium]|jgi:DNA-binding transcriptional regulator YhcF (GntR family)|nr:GntR family transcriptional regulator [Sphaerochaetaceae bacterium]NLO60877.1 GntR family transcriptional regulator [Spirochaetales bacterium]MDD2404941.1 GntR family transcriptional regulator [Sphaerochaetaceae bacterium]MDD3669798.1 GntR family transcriptional regulator [Sphaerochaetaceae bacterium]MDD4258320.1 GntR family transcriptional regulator [Sphaerochaetaceae bacterium]
MQFNEHKTIYLQIADYVYDQILSGIWPDGERIPSVRDMAVQLEVNPNTVIRTYNMLLEDGTLQNKRGIGYFTADNARESVKDKLKSRFIERELPDVFRAMNTLGISPEQVGSLYDAYMEKHSDEIK